MRKQIIYTILIFSRIRGVKAKKAYVYISKEALRTFLLSPIALVMDTEVQIAFCVLGEFLLLEKVTGKKVELIKVRLLYRTMDYKNSKKENSLEK